MVLTRIVRTDARRQLAAGGAHMWGALRGGIDDMGGEARGTVRGISGRRGFWKVRGRLLIEFSREVQVPP